jgi:hypothetical protein
MHLRGIVLNGMKNVALDKGVKVEILGRIRILKAALSDQES